MADDNALTVSTNGGPIARLSAAWHALTDREQAAVNPLGIYEPLQPEQVKALTAMPHQQGGYGSSVPVYSSWSSWDAARDGLFAGTSTDFAAKVGDLSKSSLIMAAVRVVGNTLPEAPLMVKDPGEAEGESEPINDHPLLDLLRKPNDYYAGDALWTAFAFSWITDGNVYFIKVWNKAKTKVVELWYEPHWTIRPRWMRDNKGGYIHQEGDDPNAFINYYELDRGAQKYRLEVSDVVHFRDGNDPYNPRVGWSYVRSVAREIYGDNELSNLGAQLAGGSFVPPFFIGIDPEIEYDDKAADALEDRISRKTRGDKRGRPVIVYGGKPYKLSWSPAEIDLKMLHRFSEERFCAVTGLTAEVLQLGVGKDHNIYNNYSEGQRAYYEGYLKPLYRRIAAQINLQLLPDFSPDSKLYAAHDLSQVSALQESVDAKSARKVKEYQGGIIMRSEARSALGYGPSDDANEDADKVFYSGSPQPTDQQPDATRSLKSAPSDEEIEKTVDWFDEVAPAAAGVLSAKVTNNGNGARG